MTLEELTACYAPDEYPALGDQIRCWSVEKPFSGMRILDAAPLFRNTVVKYRALIAGGADLTVYVDDSLPYDAAVKEGLIASGVPVAEGRIPEGGFDAVLDCGGRLAGVPSRLGYVELTRSGTHRYRGVEKPVFVADDGNVKIIETALGTGDGFVRGLRYFGFSELKGKRVTVFGCGKVGRGVAYRLKEEGAEVWAVDDAASSRVPSGVRLIDWQDEACVRAALETAWCAVSVTGIRHALAHWFTPQTPPPAQLILANMGVEDEFGSGVDANRVLNANKPLNFALEEPTLLRYIDPTLALHNAGLLRLPALGNGCHAPRPEDEAPILEVVRKNGCIGRELEKWEKECLCTGL